MPARPAFPLTMLTVVRLASARYVAFWCSRPLLFMFEPMNPRNQYGGWFDKAFMHLHSETSLQLAC